MCQWLEASRRGVLRGALGRGGVRPLGGLGRLERCT